MRSLQDLETSIRAGKNVYAMAVATEGRTTLEKNLLKLRSSVLQGKKEIKHSGMDPASKQQMEVAMHENIRAEVKQLIRQEQVHTENQLQALADAWTTRERIGRADREAEASRLERKLQAMTPKELAEYGRKVVGGVEEFTPEDCDAISRQLKAVDPTAHTLVREAIVKNNYDRPFLRTTEGQELMTWKHTISKANENMIPAHFDGVTTLIPLNSFLEGGTDDR